MHNWLSWSLSISLARWNDLNGGTTFGFVCWLIWLHRYKLAFDDVIESLHGIIYTALARTKDMVSNSQLLKGSTICNMYSEVLVSWQFPQNDWLKYNSDGSVRSNSSAGCGGVL